jgi:hypothetical protein
MTIFKKKHKNQPSQGKRQSKTYERSNDGQDGLPARVN